MDEATSSIRVQILIVYSTCSGSGGARNNAGVRYENVSAAGLSHRPDAKCWSRQAQYRFHVSVEGFATAGAGLVRVCAATIRSLIRGDERSPPDPFPFCSFMCFAPSRQSAQQILCLCQILHTGGAPQLFNPATSL
jgi:hypothetical protein